MEFSASFPVNLGQQAEGFVDPAGFSEPQLNAPRGFAAVLADHDGGDEVEVDGDFLPLTGEGLPPAGVPAVAELLATAALAAPAGTGEPTPVAANAPSLLAVARQTDAQSPPEFALVVADEPLSSAPISPKTPAPARTGAAVSDGSPLPAGAEAEVDALPGLIGEGSIEPSMADKDAAKVAMPATQRLLTQTATADLPAEPADSEPVIEPDAGADDAGADGPMQDGPPRPPAVAGGRGETAVPATVTDSTGPAGAASLFVADARAVQTSPRPATETAAPALRFDLEPGADVDQLAARIRWLSDRHIGEARIRLNPPELGALDIRLSVVDDETFVHISAHGAGTRELLEGSMQKLRLLLGEGGLSLGGASVDSGERGSSGRGFRFDETLNLDPAPGGVAAEPARGTGPAARVKGIDLYA